MDIWPDIVFIIMLQPCLYKGILHKIFLDGEVPQYNLNDPYHTDVYNLRVVF